MRAAVVGGTGTELTVREVERPAIGDGDVLLRVEACGVCATDLGVIARAAVPGAAPLIPGHEAVGVVEAVGAAVTDVAAGDRVGAYLVFACGRCDPCLAGEEECCSGERGLAAGITTDGGYAEYMRLPASCAIPLPDELAAEQAAPFFCAGLTSYGGLRNGGIESGQRVVIVGIGGLGHLAIPIAKALGAEVVAVTTSPDKVEVARTLGADHVIAGGEQAGEALRALGGAHLLLNTASSTAPIADLLPGMLPLSAIVVAGVSDGPVPVPAGMLARQQLRVLGSFVGSRDQIRELLALAVDAGIRPMVERFALDDVESAHGRLRANALRYRAVLTP